MSKIKIEDIHMDHGGLYDRGTCDSYYRRGINPHYYPNGSYTGKRITNLTEDEVKIYMMGYNDNEKDGHFKDWGDWD